ncbi:unnamed protein product [Phytophthora lilii]|uniref:Unnamed protein product n=1 Tax=Phytophthora lilii TaxID=2077276 RepID=A0A9W6U9M5_9STRA|nr:unnamed protein product [Phytophthora lilii]
MQSTSPVTVPPTRSETPAPETATSCRRSASPPPTTPHSITTSGTVSRTAAAVPRCRAQTPDALTRASLLWFRSSTAVPSASTATWTWRQQQLLDGYPTHERGDGSHESPDQQHGRKMRDGAYYYLLDGSGTAVADLSSVTVSLTDLNGVSMKDTLSLNAGSCTKGSKQFPSSSGGSTPTTSSRRRTDAGSERDPSVTTSTPAEEQQTWAPTATSTPTPTVMNNPATTAPGLGSFTDDNPTQTVQQEMSGSGDNVTQTSPTSASGDNATHQDFNSTTGENDHIQQNANSASDNNETQHLSGSKGKNDVTRNRNKPLAMTRTRTRAESRATAQATLTTIPRQLQRSCGWRDRDYTDASPSSEYSSNQGQEQDASFSRTNELSKDSKPSADKTTQNVEQQSSGKYEANPQQSGPTTENGSAQTTQQDSSLVGADAGTETAQQSSSNESTTSTETPGSTGTVNCPILSRVPEVQAEALKTEREDDAVAVGQRIQLPILPRHSTRAAVLADGGQCHYDALRLWLSTWRSCPSAAEQSRQSKSSADRQLLAAAGADLCRVPVPYIWPLHAAEFRLQETDTTVDEIGRQLLSAQEWQCHQRMPLGPGGSVLGDPGNTPPHGQT